MRSADISLAPSERMKHGNRLFRATFAILALTILALAVAAWSQTPLPVRAAVLRMDFPAAARIMRELARTEALLTFDAYGLASCRLEGEVKPWPNQSLDKVAKRAIDAWPGRLDSTLRLTPELPTRLNFDWIKFCLRKPGDTVTLIAPPDPASGEPEARVTVRRGDTCGLEISGFGRRDYEGLLLSRDGCCPPGSGGMRFSCSCGVPEGFPISQNDDGDFLYTTYSDAPAPLDELLEYRETLFRVPEDALAVFEVPGNMRPADFIAFLHKVNATTAIRHCGIYLGMDAEDPALTRLRRGATPQKYNERAEARRPAKMCRPDTEQDAPPDRHLR